MSFTTIAAPAADVIQASGIIWLCVQVGRLAGLVAAGQEIVADIKQRVTALEIHVFKGGIS